ncbi:MAG: hypothetical protein K2H49_04230 [Muribaculaceae bacterium]|nr:hypothetical protein [Muribaculaceae bacterium]
MLSLRAPSIAPLVDEYRISVDIDESVIDNRIRHILRIDPILILRPDRLHRHILSPAPAHHTRQQKQNERYDSRSKRLAPLRE